VCRERLTPQGVAYMSYNAYPGCHIRDLFREVMRYHTRHITDPVARAAEARRIVEMMAASGEDDDPIHQLTVAELELIERKSTGGLTHDDLNETFHSLYFHEFAALAESHGLQFLHEAVYNEGQPPPVMSQDGRALLDQATVRGFGEYEQYLDFLKLRRFRQSLVVHREAAIDRSSPQVAMDRFHYAAQLERKRSGEAIEFTNRATKAAVGTGDPLTIGALDRIGAAWPATVPFAQLLDDPAGDGDRLKQALERYFAAGIVDVQATPRIAATRISERPEVWSYPRWQAESGPFITPLTLNGIRMEDPNIRKLVLAADGTRTLDELGVLMGDRAQVEKALLGAAQLGFLIR
jgi:Predicted methyltransferase regulatory domain